MNTKWQFVAVIVLILYAVNWSLVTDVGGDEKIYLISASLFDQGININVEHPPLVKQFYNLLLTREYKAEINEDLTLRTSLLWIPNSYATEYQHQLLLRGTRYLRLVNGFLITAFLLFIWWKSKDFILFIGLFATLLMADQIFSILLDGWLFVGAVGGYYLLSVGNPLGWLLALVLAPLSKTYGFLTTVWTLVKHPKNELQTALSITSLAFVILVMWGAPSIAYTATHFWMQFRGVSAVNYGDWSFHGAFFNIRYLTPFLGLLMVKYRHKAPVRVYLSEG